MKPRRTILAAMLALGMCACAGLRSPAVPLRTLDHPDPCGPAEALIVMLPGLRSLPEEFVREGFVQQVRQEGISADVVLVDAHQAYYENRTVVERLHADVVQPALSRGVRQVWLVGISLGGVGAMLYADEHADLLSGVVLFAPYLGSRLTAQEIENAGGLPAWRAPEPRRDEEVDLRLWRWLKGQTDATVSARLPIYQGFGVDDRFAYNNRLLSRSLPPGRVFTATGGHDWPVWNTLWQRIVRELPLRRGGRCDSKQP